MLRNANRLVEPEDATVRNVFSGQRIVEAPAILLPPELKPDTRLKMDGLVFLSNECIRS